MKDELNRSHNAGGVVYVLKSELSTSTRQYSWAGKTLDRVSSSMFYTCDVDRT